MSIFEDCPIDLQESDIGDTDTVLKVLKWFATNALKQTFFQFDIDASLTEDHVLRAFKKVRETARRISDVGAIVIVFLDGELQRAKIHVRSLN